MDSYYCKLTRIMWLSANNNMITFLHIISLRIYAKPLLIHKSIFGHNRRNNTRNIVMHSRDHCMQYIHFLRLKNSSTSRRIHTAQHGAFVFKYFGISIGIHCMTSSGLRFVFLKPNQDLICIFSNTRDVCIRISCIILLIVYWKFRKTLLLLHFEALCTRMTILCTLLKLSNSNSIEQQKNYVIYIPKIRKIALTNAYKQQLLLTIWQ